MDLVQESNGPLQLSELIEIAYKEAKENFGDKFFSFSTMWSRTWKSASNFSKERVETWIGYFYTEILGDPRFVVYSFNKLKLREFMTVEEFKKFEKTVFADDSFFEEEYEAYIQSESTRREVEIVPDNADKDDDIIGDPSEEDTSEEGESNLDSDELFEADDI